MRMRFVHMYLSSKVNGDQMKINDELMKKRDCWKVHSNKHEGPPTEIAHGRHFEVADLTTTTWVTEEGSHFPQLMMTQRQ